MSQPFKIDFIGLGPAKSGSTWVGHMLDSHPQICMSEPKEVHFFNDSLAVTRTYTRSHFPLGISWYEKHFRHCAPGQIRGEITPRYFIDPVVPKRIREMNPHCKFIVCLRNPFERIVSQYHSTRDFHHSEPRSIQAAIREEPEYIDACLYYKHVSDYLRHFPMQQFHFVEMEKIKSDPVKVVSGLYAFLGVDPNHIPANIHTRSNPARATRSNTFRKLTTRIHRRMVSSGFSPFVRQLKALGLGKWINRFNSRPIEKVHLSATDKAYIREKIRDDIRQFSQLIGKDYSHWLES